VVRAALWSDDLLWQWGCLLRKSINTHAVSFGHGGQYKFDVEILGVAYSKRTGIDRLPPHDYDCAWHRTQSSECAWDAQHACSNLHFEKDYDETLPCDRTKVHSASLALENLLFTLFG